MRIAIIGTFLTLFCIAEALDAAPRPRRKRKKTEPATEQEKVTTSVVSKTKDTTTLIESDTVDQAEASNASAAPVERLFRNPVLSSGLASGADAINRTINSLMESLFYNLMDNDIQHALTGSASMSLALKRDVFQAESGAWVVVDRFGMGPLYGKELYRYQDIPVGLGLSQTNEVYDIYLRTDPMRVNENAKLPFWRTAINNWFGLLPILEIILPPSFNANEMYDPLRRVESPFTFPLSVDAFEGMETGSLKSYAINGGVNLGLELSEGVHGYKDIVTKGSSALEIKLPYTVFRTGQYRVNVLKRDLTTAWVGITDTNRTGHRAETRIGKSYYLLSKTLPYWTGLAAPVFPLDFEFEHAIADLFSRVYSFDLRNSEAQRAYLEAVHGNLAAAQLSWLRQREDKIETGVSFFYTKKERRFELGTKTAQNVFIMNRGTRRTHSDAEIEITDRDGRFYILEARQDVEQLKWDILTGGANSTYSAVADLRVRKVIEKSPDGRSEKFRFEFVVDANPIDTTLTLQTRDKFVETEDLRRYIDTLGRFSAIDILGQIPDIPIRDTAQEELRRRQVAFATDLSRPAILHTTPTHLGSFEGYASIHFMTSDLYRIAGRNREEQWQAFCDAYRISKRRCGAWQGSLFTRHLDRIGGWAGMPLKLFDVRFARLDAISEIEDGIQALRAFGELRDPEEKLEELRRLFATDHPLELSQALLALADPESVARNVQLGANPKGNGPESAKNLFRSMNGRRFHRGPKTPAAARYDSTLDTESKFNPANLSFAGAKPKIKRITLFREDPPSPFERVAETSESDTPILSVRLYSVKLEDATDVHIYVRLEQTGKIQLAKFKLAEQVFDIPVAEAAFDFAAGTSNYLVRLSGPHSALDNILLSEALSLGGNFRATFAISTNGKTWSDERHVDFHIEDGKLLPIKSD